MVLSRVLRTKLIWIGILKQFFNFISRQELNSVLPGILPKQNIALLWGVFIVTEESRLLGLEKLSSGRHTHIVEKENFS